MDAAQGSAQPVEPAQSVEAPMEIRMYLLRFDGEGSAVELARLRPCGHQMEAPLRAPAPVFVNQGAEVRRWEAAVYLAVLEGGEVKQLARLSSFLEGLSRGSSREDAEEAQPKLDTNPTATLSSDQDQNQGDVFVTLSLEDDDDEEVLVVDTTSQEEEEEEKVEEVEVVVDTSEEEEEEVVGISEEEVVDTSSQEEEEVVVVAGSSSSAEEERSSVKIRMCPALSRLVLVLFDGGNWRLTRGLHMNWLQESDEAKVLKLTGLGTEKCQNGNACPKIFSHWSQDSVSWLEFEGTLLNEKLMCAQFNASMGDFRVLKILGKGSAGKVYQCVYRNDPIHEVQYALKKMDISDDFDDIEAINGEEPREVTILSYLEDDFVVRFYQAWAADGEYKSYLSSDDEEYMEYKSYLSSDDEEYISDDEEYTMKVGLLEPRYVVIQMEFCQRTLIDDLPYKYHEINTEESWEIFEEITRGLQCMHHMGIIHRDLKPDNIFVGINGRIKIGDMGHACWAENGELIRTPNRGTLLYMAPELDSGHVTIKADIYSIGVIFMELFHPFLTGSEKREALTKLRNNAQPTDWKGDIELLMQLTALCPSDRPSTEEILDHIAQRRKNIIDSQ